jgi:hypothetical protein
VQLITVAAVAARSNMDSIDKTSIAVLAIYIFGVCLVGFYGVFKTLRNSRLGGGKAQARYGVQGYVKGYGIMGCMFGTIHVPRDITRHVPAWQQQRAAAAAVDKVPHYLNIKQQTRYQQQCHQLHDANF